MGRVSASAFPSEAHGLASFFGTGEASGNLSADALQQMHREFGALSPLVSSLESLSDSQKEVQTWLHLRTCIERGSCFNLSCLAPEAAC